MEIQKHILTNYGIIRGIVHIPEYQRPKGVVVIIHGYFSSQKIGPARFYVQLGRLFEKLGYIVYRFDAYGVGDSDGEYIEFTFESHKRDVLLIIDDIHYSYPNMDIILCGHSSGSNIAMLIVSELHEINKMILISPAFGEFSGTEKLLDEEDITALNMGKLVYRKGIPISKKYIEQIKKEDILFNENALLVKTFFFIGKDDQFYNIDIIETKAKLFKDFHIYMIEKADHNFLNPTSREELFDKLKQVFL